MDVAGPVHFCNPTAERMFSDLYQRGLGHPWLADLESFIGSPPNLHKDYQNRRFDYATDMGCDLSYDIPFGSKAK